MKKYPRYVVLAVLALSLSVVAGAGAKADRVADFYNGRQLTVIVGFGPSGGYAIYCRQLVTYWKKHIPGNPNIVCQFMPGGGGVKAANYLYNVAPPDGYTVGMVSDYAPVAQLMRPKKIKYDAAKFKWIGVMVPANPVVMVWHTAAVQKFDQLFEKELVIGLTGPLAQSGINTSLMNAFLSTKYKRITGYKSTGKIALAMERGEVEASMSSWISWKARKKKMIDEGKFVPLVQVGLTKARDLPNVPLMRDYAKDGKVRQVLDLASSAAPFGRSVLVPPGFPNHLLEALRAAFDKTVRDPEFLASAKKRNVDIDPAPGASLDPIVKKILATPPDIVRLAQKAAGIK